jgi:hypothetical protein
MLKEAVKSQNKSDLLVEFLIFVLNILIATFVLRFAWNRSLVKHITVLKPLASMLDAFILALSLNVLRGV